MRLTTLVLAAGCLSVAVGLGPAHAEPAALKYFVEVSVPSLDAAAELSTEGFDVAGFDRNAFSVGLVVTPEQLERLSSRGWPITMRGSNAPGPERDALSSYTDPQEMSAFIDQVVAAHPDLAKKIVLADALWEAQKQYAVLITKDVGAPNERPSFILDAQHHAREVMTPEIAKDMIDYLTSRYATDAAVRRWVDNIDIYIVPSVNPDGAMYVFSGDNFWRKNRHPGCPVDNNRNYPALWAACNGSSSSCGAETTRGGAPGSEPETQGLMQLTSSVRPFFTLSYHSFSELIMYPYGCSDPDERAAFDEVGLGLKAILVDDTGTPGRYGTGPIWSTIYLVDGGSIDTQYNLYGAYGFTIEVNAQAQGFQPDFNFWRNITVQRQRTAWTWFLDKTLDGPQIRVTVTDAATGAPVPANVDLNEVTFTHGESQRTADANGRHRFLVDSGGTYHVTASYPAYCAATQTIAVGNGPVNADIALIHPEVPQGVQATGAGDNAIDVTWQSTAHAAQYRVLRSLNAGGPYAEVALVPGSQTRLHDAGVSGVATYYYVVRGVEACDSSDSTAASAATTGPCTVGPAFAGVNAASSTAAATCAMTVTWPLASTRCGGTVTYNIYRSLTSPFVPGPSTLVASGLSGDSFVDHDALLSATPYAYAVRAVESRNGLDDGNAASVTAVPTGPNILGTWTDDAGDTGTAKLTPAAPWAVTAAGGNAGPHAYATGIYPADTCAALTTPSIKLASSSFLTFASKYDIQSYEDAGIVEIEVGGSGLTGGWTTLPFVNYPDILVYQGNRCEIPNDPPTPAFSHTHSPPEYTALPYKSKLSPYADQTVRFRWTFSSDYGGSGLGWWIDDIAVTNAVIPGPCTSGVAPHPKEASPDGHMTASRSTPGTAVDVVYAPGCGTLDNAVYWGVGPIAGSPVWTNAACALGNTGHAVFDPGGLPPDTLLYFVIVGQNAADEGSYGAGSAGERPEAVGIGACDKPQDLTGTCP